MRIEIWKDVPGYESFYQASSLGRVKRLATDFIDKQGKRYHRTERIMRSKARTNKPRCGYIFVTLSKHDKAREYSLHQIIALCFLPPKPFEKAEINHKDYVKTNNRADNLEWCSHADNMRHAFKHNPNMRRTASTMGIRSREFNAKLTKDQVHKIRSLFSTKKDTEISLMFNVCRKTINQLRNKKTFSWLSSPS